MPLHTDHRPNSLDDFVGNKGIIESHRAIFERQSDWPHAVLYVGQSGCGKTTLARLYAKALDCADKDLTEINAANNRGIDTARQIQTSMTFKPFAGGVKCYIIDEVGSTTKDFQVAMLKALEDAPSHAYFMMATTDPQNLLPTFKNRCAIFEVAPLTVPQLTTLINKVLEKEGVTDIPTDVIAEIATVSDGCPRQALVILDQIIDLQLEDMLPAIQDMRVTDKVVKDLCLALMYRKPWGTVANILRQMDLTNAEGIRRQVQSWMAAVLLKGQVNPQVELVMDLFERPTYNAGKQMLVSSAYKSVV